MNKKVRNRNIKILEAIIKGDSETALALHQGKKKKPGCLVLISNKETGGKYVLHGAKPDISEQDKDALYTTSEAEQLAEKYFYSGCLFIDIVYTSQTLNNKK